MCELSEPELLSYQYLFQSDVIFRRARHAVTEQARTLKAKEAMEKHDVFLFGKLLDASHQSLKNDYEVTGLHLDALVEAAKLRGAVGARVTGAGFGGCAIALVSDSKVQTFIDLVSRDYLKKTGFQASFHRVTFEDGVRRLEI